MIPYPTKRPSKYGRGGVCDICKSEGPLTEMMVPEVAFHPIMVCRRCFIQISRNRFSKNDESDFQDEWRSDTLTQKECNSENDEAFVEAPSKNTTVKTFPTLFKKDTMGRIRIWNISVEKDLRPGNFIIQTYSGLEGGKIKHDAGVRISAGKVNRTAKEQAIAEANSKWVRKLDTGYYDNKIDAVGSKRIKPMLAVRFDQKSHQVIYPAIAQRKFDGVRCLARMISDAGFNHDVSLVSRQNREWLDLDHIRQQIAAIGLPKNIVLDGEIYAHHLTFNRINGLTKKQKLDDTDKADLASTNYRIYDCIDTNNPSLPYAARYRLIRKLLKSNPQRNLILTKNYKVEKEEDVPALHQQFLDEGFEGGMIRNIDSPYEQKRSKHLQKVKKFVDEEFKIVAYKEGKGGAAGTPIWICETPEGHTFGARPMGTQQEKEEMWDERDDYVGKKVTVKYFPPKDPETGIPRFPVAKGVRSDKDMPDPETDSEPEDLETLFKAEQDESVDTYKRNKLRSWMRPEAITEADVLKSTKRKRKSYYLRIPLDLEPWKSTPCASCGIPLSEAYPLNPSEGLKSKMVKDFNPATGKWTGKIRVFPKSKSYVARHYYCGWGVLMDNVEKLRIKMRAESEPEVLSLDISKEVQSDKSEPTFYSKINTMINTNSLIILTSLTVGYLIYRNKE